MFKWLKKSANLAVQKQCKLNIALNTKTLVLMANSAFKNIFARGGEENEDERKKVVNAQKALLNYIMLGHSNGLSIDEITAILIENANEISGGSSNVSGIAMEAMTQVVNKAAETLGVQSPFAGPQFDTTITASFLRGDVRIEDYDFDNTRFRLIENSALVSVRNDSHIRLVEDIFKIPSMPFFEIIAPLTAVELLEGKIPDKYIHEYTLDYYLALQKI